ncbi:MAG: O-antigen ligase family protein [Pirellulales bacterium]
MDFLLTIAVIAAAIWAVALAIRVSPMAGCLVFLVLTTCFGYEFLHFDLGSLPLTLDRLWIGVLVVWFVVQYKLGGVDPKRLARVDIVLLGFLALITISTFVAGATAQNAGGSPLWHLVVGYLIPAVLYFVARQSALTEPRVVMVHGFLALFGIYLGLTGVAEMTSQWSLVFPRYIADPKIGLHFGRARGPMVQSVSFGLYLGICSAAALLWMPRMSRAGKLAMLLALPLPLAAAALTLTRSVWMGTALALLLLAAVVLKDWLRKLVLFGAIGAAALVVAANVDNLTSFQREGTSEDTRSSAASRASFAYVSWLMFQDRPLLGFGFGQFPEAKLPYLDDRSTSLNLEIIRPWAHHNTYLSLLVELGLVGFLLYMTLLALWAHYGWRLAQGPRRPAWVKVHGVLVLCALATYSVQMLFHEVSFTSVDNSIIFLLAGMSVGLSYPGQESRRLDVGRSVNRQPRHTESGQPVCSEQAKA